MSEHGKPVESDFHRVQVDSGVDELFARGRDMRESVPFASLGTYMPVQRDEIAMMDRIGGLMVPELLPERNRRMAASAFAFFRGTDELMGFDLEHQADTGIYATICGDAHIGNFGFYASPERHVLFDLNDFDESGINPWEWDLKRMLVSIKLAGLANKYDPDKLAKLITKCSRTYRETLKLMYSGSTLSRFGFVNQVEAVCSLLSLDKSSIELLKGITKHAEKRTSEQVVAKFAALDENGSYRFVNQPPRTVHVHDTLSDGIYKYFREYCHSARPDVALLLSQYQITDVVRHSVGVGSFGTLCYLVLLTSNDGSHLVLQIKEALPTRRAKGIRGILATIDKERGEGERIVDCQRILQSASDAFLGHIDTDRKSFYVRQFRDMKESVDIAQLSWKEFKSYCAACACVLAIAHSQSPTSAMILGYVGEESDFDAAMTSFATDYSMQVQTDYQRFLERLEK